MLDNLEGFVKNAKELYIKWKCWGPPVEKKDFQYRIRGHEHVLFEDPSDLGYTGAMKNPLVAKSIESKLLDAQNKEWLIHAAEKSTAVGPDKWFDSLLAFLKSQEDIYEQLDQLRDEDASRREIKTE